MNAFQAALNHLNGKSRTSVIKLYNESYDSKSDSKIAQYTRDIEAYELQITKIEERLTAIESEEAIANEKITELEVEIRANAESETFARKRDMLVDDCNHHLGTFDGSKGGVDGGAERYETMFVRRADLDHRNVAGQHA